MLGQSAPKFRASLRHIRSVKDGGNDTDSLRPCRQHSVQRLQIDAANGKPRNGHICRRPMDVFERHGLSRRLGTGGVNWPNGNVIRPRIERTLRLVRRVRGQANFKL